MERISVLHRELSHSYKPASRSRFVAELRLYLVNHERIIGVRSGDISRKVNGCLFVSHSENHFRSVSVRETNHFAADTRISARLFPKRSRHNDRKQNFLSADSVHFFSDNLLYFSRYSFSGRKKRVRSRTHIFHIPAFRHQRVACYNAIFRRFLVSCAEQISYQHLFILHFQGVTLLRL